MPSADESLPLSAEPPAESAEALSASYRSLLQQQPAWEPEPPTGSTADAQVDEHQRAGPPPPLAHVVEALLFVGGSPVTQERAAAAVRGLNLEQFQLAIETLNRDYRRQGRPYAIHAREGGYVLMLRQRFKQVGDQLYGQGREARLSPAAIDVLSLVAYRQPVTRQEVDSIRGLDSGALLRQLVRRNLIAVVQRGQTGQREVHYGTTPRFLELFRLRSLDDLPQTQDLQKL